MLRISPASLHRIRLTASWLGLINSFTLTPAA
jgi:hypothetical protein